LGQFASGWLVVVLDIASYGFRGDEEEKNH
jgi:hypothetical protein